MVGYAAMKALATTVPAAIAAGRTRRCAIAVTSPNASAAKAARVCVNRSATYSSPPVRPHHQQVGGSRCRSAATTSFVYALASGERNVDRDRRIGLFSSPVL